MADDYIQSDQGFRKWISYGYVSHQVDDFHIVDSNQMGDETRRFIEFTVPFAALATKPEGPRIATLEELYIFVVFSETDEELRSQRVHPLIDTDFFDAYQWNRKSHALSNAMKCTYKSSTEHELVVGTL
jgi:hypothetical protein